MTIDQIKYFIRIAETLNISKAAQSLYISESALSKSLQRMERELNKPLFIRLNNKLTLSKYGEKALTHARIILNDWNCLLDDIKSDNENAFVICSTDISLLQSAAGLYISRLSKVLTDYSTFKTILCTEEEIEKRINDNNYDIIITTKKPNLNNVYTIQFIGSFVVVYNKDSHSKVSSNSAYLGELPFNTYLIQEDKGPLNNLLTSFIQNNKLNCYLDTQTDSVLFLTSVLNNDIPAIMTRIAARQITPEKIGVIELKDTPLSFPVYILLNDKELYNQVSSIMDSI